MVVGTLIAKESFSVTFSVQYQKPTGVFRRSRPSKSRRMKGWAVTEPLKRECDVEAGKGRALREVWSKEAAGEGSFSFGHGGNLWPEAAATTTTIVPVLLTYHRELMIKANCDVQIRCEATRVHGMSHQLRKYKSLISSLTRQRATAISLLSNPAAAALTLSKCLDIALFFP